MMAAAGKRAGRYSGGDCTAHAGVGVGARTRVAELLH